MTMIEGDGDVQEADGENPWSCGSNDRRQRRFRRSGDRIYQQVEAFVASLEAIGDGVILLDRQGRVVFASSNARTMLDAQREYLCIEGDQLRFSDGDSEWRFQALRVGIENETSAVRQGRVLVVERQPPLLPLVLSIVQLPAQSPDEDASIARLMVVVRDLSHIPVPQWQVFTEHFKLSGAETRICLALADGLSLAEYSKKFHLSLHTARSHLKSVFVKTETRRQADLMRLIFSFTRL